MRELVLKMSMSVDGFVGGPHGELEWLFESLDDRAAEWIVEVLWDASLHIMGRRTFEGMKAWWPRSDEPYAAPMNAIPKAYFSRGASDRTSRRTADFNLNAEQAIRMQSWEEAEIFSGELAGEIAALKAEGGKPILAHGGAGFARTLIATGLVDEYRLLVHPVALGSGLPIFSALAAPLEMTLVETKCFAKGVVANRYRPRHDGHLATA